MLKKMKWQPLGWILLILLVSPQVVLAAEEGGSGWGWIETVGRWFNLLLLVGGIVYFARDPLKRFLTERGKGIRLQMEEAAKARTEAAAKLEQIESRLENLDRELQAMRSDARREAELERERIIAKATEEAEKIVALAEREIEGLGKAARKDLKAYAAGLAVELAEKKISQQMGRQHEERLLSGFLSDLRSKAGGGNS